MARRRTVMGLPIGRRKPRIASKALLAAGAGLAGVPAAFAASKRVAQASGRVSEEVSSGAETVHRVSDLAGKAMKVKDAADQHSTKVGKAAAVVGQLVKMGGGDGSGPPKLSHLIEEHTEVAVPRSEAYNQWTQFETFPSIVKGAEQVEQRERDKVRWTAKIGPSRRTWTTEITEQVPDERIAWKSEGGLQMRGVVTFHSLDDDLTRVLVQIQYDPNGPVEQVGNLLRIQRRRVRRDLRLFKHFIELRGEATGAWRSRIAKKDNKEGQARGGENGRNGNASGRSRTGSSGGSSGSRRASASAHRSTGEARKRTPSRSSSSRSSSSRSSSSRSSSRSSSTPRKRATAGKSRSKS